MAINNQTQADVASRREVDSCGDLRQYGVGLNNLATSWYSLKYPQLTRSFSTTTYTGVHLSLASVGTAFAGLIKETGGTLFVSEIVVCAVVILIRLQLLPMKFPAAFSPLTTPRVEAAMLVAALLHFVLVSQSSHAQSYDLNFRYFLISDLTILFLITSFCYALLSWVSSRLGFGQQTVVTAFVALIVLPGSVALGVAVKYQFPRGACFDPHGAQRETEAEVALAGDYAAVVGSYWDVWPLAFHTAILREMRGDGGRRMFPTSFRSELLQSDIREDVRRDLLQKGEVRILCAPPGPEGTDVRGLDCSSLVRWNQDWGTLPNLGIIGNAVAVPGSVRLRQMVAHPARLVRGKPVSFKASREGILYEFAGWSQPESFGSWTLGSEAELLFALDELPAQVMELRMVLLTDIGRFVVPARFLAVEVLMNDVHIATWTFNPDTGDRALRIPRALLHLGMANFLKFRISNPHSGSELGFSPTDLRQLGFALASVEWTDGPIG